MESKAGWMAGDKCAGQVDDGELGAGLLRVRGGRGGGFGLAGRECGKIEGRGREQKDLGDGVSAARDRVSGIGSGVEIKQLAQDGARARTGILGQGQGLGLGEQGTVGVACYQQGGLFRGRNLGGLGGRRVFSGKQPLMGAIAQLPQGHAHHHRSHEQDSEEDGLVAGNHGWLSSVRHSKSAAASAWATRVW
jgi:hypothetical protein